MSNHLFLPGLGSLPLLSPSVTRSISPENPGGKKGGGARETPESGSPASELGRGWKVRPCITLPGESTTPLADIDGPGVIQHIWITVDPAAYRACVLKMFWDEEDDPSVQVPLGDFFANGHGLRYRVNSLPVSVNPSGGFNCYWPMPFRKRCRIDIRNDRSKEIEGFFYQITFSLGEVPGTAGYFHAQWRREITDPAHPEYVILDAVEGTGHYVGTFLAWTQMVDGWWGEGEVKFFVDDDDLYPTICGTGTEDYFGGAWCFGETFSTPFLGYPLWVREKGENPRHGMYRWHIMDPIRFERNLKVTVQALGWWPNGKFRPLADDIASVAYWYQTEPHNRFPELPEPGQRLPR
ncbi:MAG: glycoside hydrolase family 172 protein [Fidelibacterota bacterium]